MDAESSPQEKYTYGLPPSAEFLARMEQRRDALRAELAEVLPSPPRFVWEIGCGHGHFLTAYAEAHKDQLCLGVDINIERVRRGEKKRNRAELGNIAFLRTEAELFLEVLSPETRFLAVYVLFPDPWPKKRHHKNRIIQTSVLSDIARYMDPGSPLYFRTDHAEYFAAAVETVAAHPDWELRVEEPWPFEEETVFQKKAPSYQSLTALRRQA